MYSSFKDNISNFHLADMQSLSRYNKGFKYLLCAIRYTKGFKYLLCAISYNKGFKYLLCAINLFSKYAWVIPIKD